MISSHWWNQYFFMKITIHIKRDKNKNFHEWYTFCICQNWHYVFGIHKWKNSNGIWSGIHVLWYTTGICKSLKLSTSKITVYKTLHEKMGCIRSIWEKRHTNHIPNFLQWYFLFLLHIFAMLVFDSISLPKIECKWRYCQQCFVCFLLKQTTKVMSHDGYPVLILWDLKWLKNEIRFFSFRYLKGARGKG